MVLSDKDIFELIEKKIIKITPTPSKDEIKCTHVNLHLSNSLRKYKNKVLDLKKNSSFKFTEITMDESGYKLEPEEFVLASTFEKAEIPNGYFGFVETKGNIARAGIQAHNTDGHVDPGFSGHITLELKNNSNQQIIIYPKIPIVQLYLFKVSSKSINPYNGKYQNQKKPSVYVKD